MWKSLSLSSGLLSLWWQKNGKKNQMQHHKKCHVCLIDRQDTTHEYVFAKGTYEHIDLFNPIMGPVKLENLC